MPPRQTNMRQALISAGIEEINANGVHQFSIRRVASACNVSCAAPYKHFRDKQDFIVAIIEYVNDQWHIRQQAVLDACGGSLRERIVEITVQYIRFLMEKPYYRAILMLKDDGFDNLYHRTKGQMHSLAQRLQEEYFYSMGFDKATCRRKLLLVRSMIFGSVFLFDSGELEYSEETVEHIRRTIDREFDLP